MTIETVTITREEFEDLLEAAARLRHLEEREG